MELQAEISHEKNRALIGSVQRVMMCGADPETQRLHGRTQAHAPEVDGVVFVSGNAGTNKCLTPGTFANVTITDASEYDLIGEIRDA
jgi:ribosomal protein S12 methylthiotransferase